MDSLINPPMLLQPNFGVSYTDVQGGQGFFSVFSKIIPLIKNLFSKAAPLAKGVVKSAVKNPMVREAAKELKQQAVDAGLSVTSDMLRGENLGDSIKKSANILTQNMADKMVDISKQNRRKRKTENNTEERPVLTDRKKNKIDSSYLRKGRQKKKKKKSSRRDLFG